MKTLRQNLTINRFHSFDFNMKRINKNDHLESDDFQYRFPNYYNKLNLSQHRSCSYKSKSIKKPSKYVFQLKHNENIDCNNVKLCQAKYEQDHKNCNYNQRYSIDNVASSEIDGESDLNFEFAKKLEKSKLKIILLKEFLMSRRDSILGKLQEIQKYNEIFFKKLINH